MTKQTLSTSDVNFDQDVLEREGPILLWFRANWCGPCDVIDEVMQSLSEEFTGVELLAIDVDEHPEIPVAYGVKALPTVMLMRQGDVVERISGATERPRLRALFERATSNDE